MPSTKHIFVGRKAEQDQFRQAFGQPGKIERLVFNPGHNVKAQVFLPHGIGGIGKSELSKRCLQIAKEAKWKTVAIDFDKVEYRPVEPLQVMNAIAKGLQSVAGEGSIKEYLDDRDKIKPVQDRVHRYRAEHPEEWQKLVEFAKTSTVAMPTVETKALAAGATAALAVGPQALAKAYDMLADKMVETKQLKDNREALLFKDADALLARHLSQAIANAAKQHGLVILLDTCEVLSLALEDFLRDSIVCPAVEKGSGLIFIISGRFSQYRERQVEDSDGDRRSIKGYADRLTDPMPINWDLSLFADPEIADYLRESELDPQPELVNFVQHVARGVPFAVQLVAEALLKIGPERVKKEFPPKDPAEFSPQEMVTLVARRFLRYCLDDPQDESRLRALAMLRSRDEAVLRAAWKLKPEEYPRQILADLEARYGFVQPDGTLHEVVRDFLRDNLRGDDRGAAERLGKLMSAYYQPLWTAETDKLLTLEERCSESRWRNVTLDLLNALCWSDLGKSMTRVSSE